MAQQTEEERNNVIIGLSAGIGGFLLFFICLVGFWKLCCGS